MSKALVLGYIERSAGLGVSAPYLRNQTGLSEPEVQNHLDALIEEGFVMVDGTLRHPDTSAPVPRYVVAQASVKQQSALEATRRSVIAKVKGLNQRQLVALDAIIDKTIKKI